jgi:hypothetical protein
MIRPDQTIGAKGVDESNWKLMMMMLIEIMSSPPAGSSLALLFNQSLVTSAVSRQGMVHVR